MHRSALGPGALSDEWAAERLPRHAARAGFVFLVARAADGSVAGFAYGYDGARGHWWSDQVARSLSAAQRAEWLDRPHYEVAELHVLPGVQRHGIGSTLLAYLLTRQPHDRAILSTQTGSRKARDFYAKNGWQELAAVDFGPGYPPYLVLGQAGYPARRHKRSGRYHGTWPSQTAAQMVFVGLGLNAWGLFYVPQEVALASQFHQARLLTVEDDPIVRADLRLILEDAGFDVVPDAHDGVELSSSLRASAHLDPIDLSLPRLDGVRRLARSWTSGMCRSSP